MIYWILVNGLPHGQEAQASYANEPRSRLPGKCSELFSGTLPCDDSRNQAPQKLHVPPFRFFTLERIPLACGLPFSHA